MLAPNFALGKAPQIDPFNPEANQLSDEDQARESFRVGKFDEAELLAAKVESKLGDFNTDDQWAVLRLRSLLSRGKYSQASKTLTELREKYENSIQIRWWGAEVLRFNNQPEKANAMLVEIEQAVLNSAWRYRATKDQITIGRFNLWKGVDAKRILTKYYNPTRANNPGVPEIYNAIGELALSKHDYKLAADNYRAALKLDEKNIESLIGLARAFEPSDSKKATEFVNLALEIDPNCVEALLMVVDHQVASEQYVAAELGLAKIIEINPHHPEAWAYRAVLAHLENDPGQEGKCRSAALKHWPGNPLVDHLIGRELSQKYRFKESATYQRRSLVYDKNYLPAKAQLAHDLLRLGQELEGWKLADEVFDADQYSVVAHNLVTLRDNLSKFTTIKRDGFVVRMAKEEAEIYGERVLSLLTKAKEKLATKYEAELETPIFIEIFPRQQDFAIRTFGLPGGDGFLGVCFGRLITMNSPAAQSSLTSWESVLWHEFCHVVTLQKTKNKMPRWLSEGISVYEERLADSAWGDSMSSMHREMVLGDELTPVSQLSGAFLRPKSAAHLQFAYYESSMVVEYLIEKHKLSSVKNILTDLSLGTPINDALRRHAAPTDFLDKDFAKWIREKANQFAPDADWEKPELSPRAGVEDWAAWNEQNPNNIAGLTGWASALIKEENFEEALARINEVIQLTPEGSKTGQALLAQVYRKLEQPSDELVALETLASLDANSTEVLVRLMQLTSETESWEKTKKYSRRMLALNPLLPIGHRYLARAAEATEDDEATIESLSVLSKMNPLDAADVHYRLANALYRSGDVQMARQSVVKALEQAPRYRDAHRLLLKIVEQQKSEASPDSAEEKSTPPSAASDVPANQTEKSSR